MRDNALDSEHEVEGPTTSASPQAITGFAKKHGVTVESLERRAISKGEVFVAHFRIPGAKLDVVLPRLVEEALKKLPIPKTMRWGAGEAQFVRPVHGLVMLHGERPVPGRVLGLESGNRTRGHRFMGKGEIALASADEYETRLREDGMVIADFAVRRAEIARLLDAEARRHRASLGEHEELLDEVTALVEWPSVCAGEFERKYLEVPQECLTLTMRQNQKYFPLFDAGGKLLPKFLIVSNTKAADPRHVIAGNERVVRPRLEDARFFYDQDRKTRLEERVPRLARVVYHGKLGTQLERVERIQLLAGRIARDLKADGALAERAAWLAKADLLTGMVGEFPELQGTMGRYYAMHDGEPRAVADAIEAHYRPRFAGDALPGGKVACAVALADKLEALDGMFSVGGAPTGEKDPFGLRRAALGVLRILIEARLPLELSGYAKGEVYAFIMERLRYLLRERGHAADEIEAVVSQAPSRIDLVPARLEAVAAFRRLPEAGSLAAANKRVANILKQASGKGESYSRARRQELKESEEIALFDALEKTANRANQQLEQGNYTGFLKSFAVMKQPVDAFFDKVMVMAEDAALRRNRLALLSDLREAMNRVADLSKLAA